jgi:hypothetical protein
MTYWTAAAILIVLNAGGVVSNLLLLPGNWIMVATLCLFLLVAGHDTAGPDWSTLLIVSGMAAAGELIELLAGSATAAKAGATRRAMTLSLIGSFVLSIAGTFVIPIPVIGTVVGAIAGAAIGAFGGAWLGEAWAGTPKVHRNQIGKAAVTGRLLGMTIKITIGAAIFVVQLVSLWM